MKLSNNVVVVVAHNKNIKYLEKFKKNLSLEKSNFDVIIFCDNVFKQLDSQDNLIFVKIKKKISPIQVRSYLINYLLKKNYLNVMFCDLEDFFKYKRVIATFKNLKKYDIVFNNINLLKNKKIIKKNIFSNFFKSNAKISFNNVVDSNFFGFCNTGVKVKMLKSIKIPKNIIAADWWIFTLMTFKTKKIKFMRNISTNYRLDETNLLGINKKINKKKLKILINIKFFHYLNITKYCNNFSFNYEKRIYKKKLKNFKILRLKVQNQNFLKKLIKKINKRKLTFFNGWFSELTY